MRCNAQFNSFWFQFVDECFCPASVCLKWVMIVNIVCVCIDLSSQMAPLCLPDLCMSQTFPGLHTKSLCLFRSGTIWHWFQDGRSIQGLNSASFSHTSSWLPQSSAVSITTHVMCNFSPLFGAWKEVEWQSWSSLIFCGVNSLRSLRFNGSALEVHLTH